MVTVTNVRTGVSGSTAQLGRGVVRGTLSRPVPIEAGDSYTVRNSGVVDTGDGHRASVFEFGRSQPFTYSASGSRIAQQYDMPMLFATPHPYY